MSFKELSILELYKTYKNNIVKEFYIPVLSQTVLYQRAVGFFSSAALFEMTKGIYGIIKNKGKIQLIVSPYLSQEDIDAINKGYEKKQIIERALSREFREPENYFQEERLNWLAHLIEDGYLDIKVAFTPPNKKMGMYHEKVGIATDLYGNKIAFTGSMNETPNAFHNNYESLVVFNSWDETRKYTNNLYEDFKKLWNGEVENLEIIGFPDVLKERFKSYKKEKLNPHIDIEEFVEDEPKGPKYVGPGIPMIPEGLKLRDYQIAAIDSWRNHEYRGIFDMATGTGKTYTGLSAIVKLFEDKKRLAIIIVCPFQHLVEQWVEDIELFNIKPIIGYSASKQRDWKQKLKDAVLNFSLEVIDTFCFVTTNATYSSHFVTNQITLLESNALLVVDEAHNFGAPTLREKLHSNFDYRLALSATMDRHGDKEGTQCLKEYFGEKCIEYDLRRAIKEKMLTPYYYYPRVVYLYDDELEKYKDISYRISKEYHKDKYGKLILTKKGERLLIERARIIAGAKGKLEELRILMEEYKDKTHMLIYCGATKVQTFNQDTSGADEEEERQIVAVSKILGNEFGMKVTHFTSNEPAPVREDIKKRFATVNPYQAIVAIKCLDEGMNIPSIKTAFILASTTNPKEYIQRRGRVLRLAEDKQYAVIYDFVTLAKPLDAVNQYDTDYTCEKTLAKRELARIKEFGTIAENSRDSDKLITDLEDAYFITEKELEEAFDGNEFKE